MIIGALCAVLLLPATGMAQGPFGPLNDLLALGQGGGQTPDTVPTIKRAAPPLGPTPPPSHCDPGSHPEPSVDGRVPAGSADNGLSCNVTLLSHQGTSGGFKVYRYVDAQGHECAYYDTALLFPLNAFNLNSSGVGVRSMVERLQRRGGRLSFASTPGQGAEVRAWMPVSRRGMRVA